MNIGEWLKITSDASCCRTTHCASTSEVFGGYRRELDEGIVYDVFMVIVPDNLFTGGFYSQFGDCFVQNDRECVPPVFTRFKSYAWLRKNFERRLAIASWIFGKSIVIAIRRHLRINLN